VTFSETSDGEKTSKEALAVLIECRARGYRLEKDHRGTIGISTSAGSTSFAYSNADIVRLGGILLRTARE
jgi:hypothetical protein